MLIKANSWACVIPKSYGIIRQRPISSLPSQKATICLGGAFYMPDITLCFDL